MRYGGFAAEHGKAALSAEEIGSARQSEKAYTRINRAIQSGHPVYLEMMQRALQINV